MRKIIQETINKTLDIIKQMLYNNNCKAGA
nr:MAG TPA: hypothetical protein [Caudoviricetes sp.]